MSFFTKAEKLELDQLASRPGELGLPGQVLQASNTFSSVKHPSSSSSSSPKSSSNTPSSSSTTTDHRWPPRAIFACRRITARRRTVWSEQNLQSSTREFGREWSLQSFLHGFFEVIVILSLLLVSLSLSLHLFWLGNHYWMFLHFLWKTLENETL